jgi:hypothetical protein
MKEYRHFINGKEVISEFQKLKWIKEFPPCPIKPDGRPISALPIETEWSQSFEYRDEPHMAWERVP